MDRFEARLAHLPHNELVILRPGACVISVSGKAALARVQLFSLARLDLAASAAQESRLGVCQTEQY